MQRSETSSADAAEFMLSYEQWDWTMGSTDAKAAAMAATDQATWTWMDAMVQALNGRSYHVITRSASRVTTTTPRQETLETHRLSTRRLLQWLEDHYGHVNGTVLQDSCPSGDDPSPCTRTVQHRADLLYLDPAFLAAGGDDEARYKRWYVQLRRLAQQIVRVCQTASTEESHGSTSMPRWDRLWTCMMQTYLGHCQLQALAIQQIKGACVLQRRGTDRRPNLVLRHGSGIGRSWDVNVSHDGHRIVAFCAVMQGYREQAVDQLDDMVSVSPLRVGIDVVALQQHERSTMCNEAYLDTLVPCFTPREQCYINMMNGEALDRATMEDRAHHLWSVKEAMFKAFWSTHENDAPRVFSPHGYPLDIPVLPHLEATPGPWLIRLPTASATMSSWQLWTQGATRRVGARYATSLVLQRPRGLAAPSLDALLARRV